MPLVPFDGEPGLWRAPNWQKNMPGVYALIVGVSDYPFLGGGTKKASETYGLEQLVASATTAVDFFEWLRGSFHKTELELVWCKLLLAPTAAERKKLQDRKFVHYDEATNERFRRAIQWWTGNLPTEKRPSENSRSLFFFSGHGVQANNVPLLLPSDYLDSGPGQPQFENCISALELKRWMEVCSLGEHLALIDACRNEFSPLAAKGATANTVFPVNLPGSTAPRGAAGLSATSPSMVAYQLPGKRLSVFGQALIDGLKGLNQASGSLSFRQLVDYVRPRVNEILKQANATVLQPVRPWIDGSGGELIVTEIEPNEDGLEAFGFAALGLDGGEEEPVAAAERALDAQFDKRFDTPIPLPELRVGEEAHDLFGHEYASEIWREGRVNLRSLLDGKPPQNGDELTLNKVDRNDESSLIRIDVALPKLHGGVALVFEGEQDVQRERLVLSLPTDRENRVPIRLTLTVARDQQTSRIKLQGVTAGFGPTLVGESSEATRAYEYLWSIHQQADLGSLLKAADSADLGRLRDAVEHKLLNPTAAMAAALLLVQAGQVLRLEDWTRNLQNYFPETPDGVVLWCESLRQSHSRGDTEFFGVGEIISEAARALIQLKRRGVPFLAGAVELAERQARWLLRQKLDESLRTDIEAVREMLELASSISVPGGHFMAYSGTPRPAKLAGSGPLGTEEILGVIRPGLGRA